jgi:L-rhamnose-H+ transport protein
MMEMFLGIVFGCLAGLFVGSAAWPVKLMKHYRYEQWSFVAMTVALLVVPWTLTLIFCRDVFGAYAGVGSGPLWKAVFFSLFWGVANILAMICIAKIGVSLTFGILTGVGVSVGVTVPMIFKGSGQFSGAPGLFSAAGGLVTLGVLVMLAGVFLMSKAGLKRDGTTGASPLSGIVMCLIAGVLSVGFSFSFVYCQAPIIEAMAARGAGPFVGGFAVWAISLTGAGLLNSAYFAFLMTRNRSWDVLFKHPSEALFGTIFGVMFISGFLFMGKGMLLLGALGASVGFGLQQSSQILGSQIVGFAGGEWKQAGPAARRMVFTAIAVLILAAVLMATGNSMA